MARPTVKDERRTQILDALYAVVAERGGMGASITEIAEQAGVARGALHYFFENKGEITASLMERLGERYLESLDAFLQRRMAHAQTDVGMRARLVAEVARYHFRGDADDAMRRITVWIDYWGQAASQPEIRGVVQDIQERVRQLIARALVAQRPELAALDDAHLRAHAASVLALIEGGLLQWRVAADSAHPLDREVLGAAIAQAAASAVLAIHLPPRKSAPPPVDGKRGVA